MASKEELRDVVREELFGGTRDRLNAAVRLGQVAAAGSVAAIRREVKLDPDPVSDLVHVERIRTGKTTASGEPYDLREVRARFDKAAVVHMKGGGQDAGRHAEGVDPT